MKPRHNRPVKRSFAKRRTVIDNDKTPTDPRSTEVEFILERPGARSVSLAGSFNNWDPTENQMSRDLEDVWKARIFLQPGRYEYRFVVDGQWLSDPNAAEIVNNQFGTTNSVLIVR